MYHIHPIPTPILDKRGISESLPQTLLSSLSCFFLWNFWKSCEKAYSHGASGASENCVTMFAQLRRCIRGWGRARISRRTSGGLEGLECHQKWHGMSTVTHISYSSSLEKYYVFIWNLFKILVWNLKCIKSAQLLGVAELQFPVHIISNVGTCSLFTQNKKVLILIQSLLTK